MDKLNLFWHKIRYWEFWPFNVLYFPVFFYFTYLAFKARSFFFFSSSNPSIDFGGMLGESKAEIFELIPDEYIPRTYKFRSDVPVSEIEEFMQESGLNYPVIAKPDIGERGWMVKKINSHSDLTQYLKLNKVDFLIQEYVSFGVELGIFYHRLPDDEQGCVTSIVMKEMLSVTGDGKTKLELLIKRKPRAFMQLPSILSKGEINLEDIPSKGEKVELENIGNHCKGTTFLSANHKITPLLNASIDAIAKKIEGFYFGRFDLRCESFEALEKGMAFKVMELNGAGAEPAHIYQPGYGLLRAYRDIFYHLTLLYRISMENKKNGVDFIPFKKGLAKMREIRRYNRDKSQ